MKERVDDERGDEWNCDLPSRRRRSPFRGLFDDDPFDPFFDEPFSMGFEDIDRRFARMRAEMDRMFGAVDRGGGGPTPADEGRDGGGDVRRFGPYVYGYRMHVGPDGVPHVQKFGNAPGRGSPRELGTSETPAFKVSPPDASPRGGGTGTCGGEVPASVKSAGPTDPSSETPLYEVNECDGDLYLVVELPGIGRKDIDLRLDDNVLRMDARGSRRNYTLTIPLPGAVKLDRRKVHHRNGVLEVCLPRLGGEVPDPGGEEGRKGHDDKKAGDGEGEGKDAGFQGEGSSGGPKNIKIN